ncbi:MAG TPA: restriction endonuclease subunit S [Pirellulaceae bacterium]|nr:restriction endonuclease subunit S [Pirellulaceae bacterium]HMO93782.1 restriction endonuclease subunit S [Pirellulaceae bacterium]
MNADKRWPVVHLGEVLDQFRGYIAQPEPRQYPKLSVKLYGKGVVLDSPADGTSLKMKRHQVAKAGQVILSEIWGKKGAIGIVPDEGEGALCTSHFFLFDVNRDRVEPGWLHAIFRANYLQEELGSQAFGTTGYAAVRPKTLLAANIPLPPLEEQRRIVARIDSLVAKLDEVRITRQLQVEKANAMLRSRFSQITFHAPRKKMSIVAPLVRRPAKLEVGDTYPELGIRSYGKGTFHKPALDYLEVGSKKLYSIEPGDLVFSNVFAWEGAIAVAQPEDSGRFGSHRFITCVPDKGIATADFLCFYFLTSEGLERIGAASPGGAGRNRTLGLNKLAEIDVPVPQYDSQIKFDRLILKVREMRQTLERSDAEIDALVPSILDRAFQGGL